MVHFIALILIFFWFAAELIFEDGLFQILLKILFRNSC